MQEEGGEALTSPSPSHDPDPAARGRGAHVVPALIGAVITAVLDQTTKIWALAALTPGQPVEILGEWLRLNIIRNPGAAFSLGDGLTWLLTAFAVGVCAYVLVLIRRTASQPWALALGLILGGAVGNLIDRFFRAPGPGRGHVVDFIDYGIFVGNVADIAIVLAAIAMVWLALRSVPIEGASDEAQIGRHVDG